MSGLTPTKNPLPIRSRVESSAGKKRKGLVKVEGEEIGGDVQRDLPVEGGYIGEFVVEGYTMVKGSFLGLSFSPFFPLLKATDRVRWIYLR